MRHRQSLVPGALQRVALLRRTGTHLVPRGYVYILANKKNGTIYVGAASNIARRLTEHREGVMPGFTRRHGLNRLVHVEEYDSILDARAREHSMKRWRRAWKVKLIEAGNPNWRDLSPGL